MKQCEAETLDLRCELEAGHDGEHENQEFYWLTLPVPDSLVTPGNPFARRRKM